MKINPPLTKSVLTFLATLPLLFVSPGCKSEDANTGAPTFSTFYFSPEQNSGLTQSVMGTIDESTKEIVVTGIPEGVSLENLVASFSTSMTATVTGPGGMQQSGSTSNDYTSIVEYTVASGSLSSTYQVGVYPPVADSITVDSSTEGQLTLSWIAASGADSYTLDWRSSTGETGTISDISGLTYTHTGLIDGREYYYLLTAKHNVIGSLQQAEETRAVPVGDVILFNIGIASNGAVAATHQSLCDSTHSSAGYGKSVVKPFISGSHGNLKDLITVAEQKAKNITGPTGTVISTTWDGFFDSSIDVALQTAGVLPASSAWWSFSNADGTIHTEHCNYGTDSTSSYNGAEGMSSNTTYHVYSISYVGCQFSIDYLLCAAW